MSATGPAAYRCMVLCRPSSETESKAAAAAAAAPAASATVSAPAATGSAGSADPHMEATLCCTTPGLEEICADELSRKFGGG